MSKRLAGSDTAAIYGVIVSALVDERRPVTVHERGFPSRRAGGKATPMSDMLARAIERVEACADGLPVRVTAISTPDSIYRDLKGRSVNVPVRNSFGFEQPTSPYNTEATMLGRIGRLDVLPEEWRAARTKESALRCRRKP